MEDKLLTILNSLENDGDLIFEINLSETGYTPKVIKEALQSLGYKMVSGSWDCYDFLAYWLKNGLETLDEGTLTIIALFLVSTSLFTIGASFQAFESFIFYFNCYFNPLVMILQAV